MNDLSKRANLQGVREVRGLVLASPDPAFTPTQVVESEWSPLVRAEIEREDSENWRFIGQASIVGKPYVVRDAFGEFQETMHAGFVTKTLSENPDVMHNFMHDPVTTMSTTRGGGLVLGANPHLDVLSIIPRTDPDGQRFMPKVQRGDAASMSLAFRVMDQRWNDDYTERDIYAINMHRGDVASIVSGLGANPPAWGIARSARIGFAPEPYQRDPADELVVCPHCGKSNDTDAAYCDQCGFAMDSPTAYMNDGDDVVICPQCDRGNAPDASFCDQCGCQLVGATGVTQNSAHEALTTREFDPDFLQELVAVQLRTRGT